MDAPHQQLDVQQHPLRLDAWGPATHPAGHDDRRYAGVLLNGTEYVLQPNSPFSNVNVWVHWALVSNGSTLSLYRDWQQIAQRTRTVPWAS